MLAVFMGMPTASCNGRGSDESLDELHEPLTGMQLLRLMIDTASLPMLHDGGGAHAVTCSDYNFNDGPAGATGSVVIIKDSSN